MHDESPLVNLYVWEGFNWLKSSKPESNLFFKIQGVPYGNGGFRSLIMKNLHTFQNFRRHHSWRYKPTFWFLEKNRKKFFFRKKKFRISPHTNLKLWCISQANCGALGGHFNFLNVYFLSIWAYILIFELKNKNKIFNFIYPPIRIC